MNKTVVRFLYSDHNKNRNLETPSLTNNRNPGAVVGVVVQNIQICKTVINSLSINTIVITFALNPKVYIVYRANMNKRGAPKFNNYTLTIKINTLLFSQYREACQNKSHTG